MTAGDSATTATPIGPCVDHAGVVIAQAEEAGPIAHVSFASPLVGSVVVQITPMSAEAAKCGLYVTPGSTSFTVHAAVAPSGTVTFSYLTLGVLD